MPVLIHINLAPAPPNGALLQTFCLDQYSPAASKTPDLKLENVSWLLFIGTHIHYQAAKSCIIRSIKRGKIYSIFQMASVHYIFSHKTTWISLFWLELFYVSMVSYYLRIMKTFHWLLMASEEFLKHECRSDLNFKCSLCDWPWIWVPWQRPATESSKIFLNVCSLVQASCLFTTGTVLGFWALDDYGLSVTIWMCYGGKNNDLR